MSDNSANLQELRELVGVEAYDAIICRFGGEKIYIPKDAMLDERNEAIKADFDRYMYSRISSSVALERLKRKYRLSSRTIRRILGGRK